MNEHDELYNDKANKLFELANERLSYNEMSADQFTYYDDEIRKETGHGANPTAARNYVASEISKFDKNANWNLREAKLQYMPADLEEKHELHKSIDRLNETLSRIADSLKLIEQSLDNMDNNLDSMDTSFTGIGDVIADAGDSIAESVNELSNEV